MRVILHIDFDSFFASVEQQYNPLLRGKPVGVTAANGRTCIIASSREAKRLGIKTGSRTYEAIKVCPNIILVKADFVKYFEVSKKFLNICKDFSPYVEMFSIDELFMDITSTEHLFGADERSDGARLLDRRGRVCNIIKLIKRRIRHEIGEYITVSVGISHNKLLAKLASGIAKSRCLPATPSQANPHAKQSEAARASGLRGGRGVFEIKSIDVQNVYAKAKLTDVCGIGERIKLRLNKIGIYTLLQLRDVPLSILISEFGNVEGYFLKNIGLGVDESPVVPYTIAPEVKSVGRNYCLPKNEHDKRVVMQNLFELCEEVGIKLRRLNKKARTIGVSLRGNINVGGRQTYSIYMDSGVEIFRALTLTLSLREREGVRVKYVRQISVWVSNLENKENIQQSLFDSARKNSLQQTIDAINERFGDHTIRNGFLLYADKLTTVPNGYMADKNERMKLSREDNL